MAEATARQMISGYVLERVATLKGEPERIGSQYRDDGPISSGGQVTAWAMLTGAVEELHFMLKTLFFEDGVCPLPQCPFEADDRRFPSIEEKCNHLRLEALYILAG